MSDLDMLRELTVQIRPPQYDDLVGVARKRRRRSALGGASAAAAVIVAVAAVATGVPDQRGADPVPVAPEPSTTESSSPRPPSDGVTQRFPALSPDEIRNHPDATVEQGDDIPVTGAPGVGARVWSVCLDRCRPGDDSTWVDGTLQHALEVTSDGFRTSALHELKVRSTVSHAVDDWFFVQGQGSVLVDSTGRRQALTQGAPLPATEVAGPIVHTGHPYSWIDLEARELHPLESQGSGGAWEWWGAGDTWFWGNVYFVKDSGRITQQGLTWRNPDGSFGVRLLPIEFTGYSTQMLRAGTPGTMAAVDPSPPGLVHVSTDYGASWQVRTIPPDVERSPSGPLTDSSLPDDWETWPTP